MSIVDRYVYRVTWSEDDQEFVGLCAEFPSLSHLDKDDAKAYAGIKTLVRDIVEDMLTTNEEPPKPINDRSFSGNLRLRMPPAMHQRLAIRAAEEKTSINRLILEQLS
jgi:predicted HicB family RNase H-like nuclease